MTEIKPVWTGPAGRRVPRCELHCPHFKSGGIRHGCGHPMVSSTDALCGVCLPAIWALEAAVQQLIHAPGPVPSDMDGSDLLIISDEEQMAWDALRAALPLDDPEPSEG